MSISKLKGVALGSISKVDGVVKGDISEINGVTVPAAFSNTKSLFTDGSDDYFNISLSSDIIPRAQGSVSCWVNVDSSNTSTKVFWTIFDSSELGKGRMDLIYFNTSGSNVFGLMGLYRENSMSGSFGTRQCVAKTAASHHGAPFNRIASDYGSFGSASDSIYNANDMKGNWHHVVYTWDTSDTYTHSSTTHTGVMKLYFDGTLVNFGQSTVASHNSTGTAAGLTVVASDVVFDTIRIGANRAGGQSIDALTDEWALFDKVLSLTEVQNIYNSGVPGDLSGESDLIGWWRFEDNTNDSSSNSNSGTLTNGATYNSSVPS